MSGDVQPWSGASMIPHRSKPKPIMDSTAPTGSERLATGFLELGTRKTAATKPAIAIGTLIRKTEPHQ